MTNKELFIQELDKHWLALKINEDTIFENIEIQLDAENKFLELKENHPDIYMDLLHENSTYEKKKTIKEYFWDRIVGEFYENTLEIMDKAGLLEEASRSFSNSYKIEETARLILENGIFAGFKDQKKKELINLVIEATFYPATYAEKYPDLTVTEEGIILEGWGQNLKNAGAATGRFVTGAARSVKSMLMILTTFLVSPATVLLSQVATQGVDKMGLSSTKGTSPSMQKFYSVLDSLSPVNMVFTFLNKDQMDLYKYLKQTNDMDNEYIQDILKTAGGNSNKMVEKCWNQNKIQMQAKDRESATLKENIIHFISGKGMSNLVRNPLYNNEKQLALILQSDAADPTYQKRFYDFRVCTYDKLFELILGYAKAIYSMDNESYEVIKAANSAHQTKNYKAFFDLKPKQDSDTAMFAIMKALVAVDSIARSLENNKGVLAADKYIDKFSQYLTQNVKQTYQELDELASLRKYNSDRYDEEDPDDEAKAKAIQDERFNAKKSIFTN